MENKFRDSWTQLVTCNHLDNWHWPRRDRARNWLLGSTVNYAMKYVLGLQRHIFIRKQTDNAKVGQKLYNRVELFWWKRKIWRVHLGLRQLKKKSILRLLRRPQCEEKASMRSTSAAKKSNTQKPDSGILLFGVWSVEFRIDFVCVCVCVVEKEKAISQSAAILHALPRSLCSACARCKLAYGKNSLAVKRLLLLLLGIV